MSGFECLERNGVRYLVSGERKVVHGHMDIQNPDLPLVPYLRTVLASTLYFERLSGPFRTLVVGLGTGVVPKAILNRFHGWHVTTVEIDPEVIEIAHESFSVPRVHENFKLVQACGFDFISNCSERFDWIFVDGFNELAEPGPLGTSRFLESCRALLKPNSILVFNGLTIHQNADEWRAQMETVFNRQVHQIHLSETRNFLSVVLPVDFRPPSSLQLLIRADHLAKQTGLDFSAELGLLHIS